MEIMKKIDYYRWKPAVRRIFYFISMVPGYALLYTGNIFIFIFCFLYYLYLAVRVIDDVTFISRKLNRESSKIESKSYEDVAVQKITWFSWVIMIILPASLIYITVLRYEFWSSYFLR